MMASNVFESPGHIVRRVTERGDGLAIEANQYLIVDGDEGIVLDPGGPKIYPALVVELRATLGSGELRYVFLSHQDPDVVTSLNAWLVDTEAEVYTSKLWGRFVPHFGVDRLLADRLKPIPDEGMRLPLGRTELVILPAHFLHSCGNFQIYDPRSKTLFSGDLGASIDAGVASATRLAPLLPHMLDFHRRYMASRRVLAAWAKMARQLDVERIAPQHGAVLEGRAIVAEFIDWVETLDCGIDLLEDAFQIPE